MGGSKESSTSTTKVEIPQEIRDRGSQITTGAMGNYFDPGGDRAYNYGDYASQGADRTGQLNGYNSGTGQSGAATTRAQTSYQPYMGQAAGQVDNAASKIGGQGYTDNINQYMSPYLSQVRDATMAQSNHQYGIDTTKLKDQVAGAGAFGNDRRAILEAELANGKNLNDQTTLANLNQGAFQNAQGQANTAFNQGMQASDQYAQLGTTTQASDIAAANAAQQQGNLMTAQEQAQKDNAVKAYEQPMDTYERLAGINAMQPVNRTSTTNGTTDSGGGWLGPALYAGGTALSMMSDENLKEDIADISPEKVLGAFSKIEPKTYRYTDEARDRYPAETEDGTRTGFMAQNYEDAFGEDVVDHGGYKAMDIPNVIGKLVVAVNGLEARTRKFKKAS